MFDFAEHPGRLFVIATLLPLLSFVLLLLAGAVRAAARPYREEGFGAFLYGLTGGDQPGRTPAYVALGAIGLAFVLCATGFVLFAADSHGHGAAAKHADHGDHWAERFYWAQVFTPPAPGKHPTEEDREAEPGKASFLELGYRIDNLASIMFVMVTLIATLIHLFSIGYMADELQRDVEDHQAHVRRRGRFGRFFMFLSLFCFSMLNLVLADNLFQVFVSWELVGICSYLLIGFYYERTSASNAANKAFITNRIGDAGFIIGLMVIWTWFGTFNFEEIFRQVRAPFRDAHGSIDPEMAGLIVRGQKTGTVSPRGFEQLAITDGQSGDQVLLFPAHQHLEAKEGDDHAGHFDGFNLKVTKQPDGKGGEKRFFQRDADGNILPVNKWAVPTAGWDDYSSMPYWLLTVAGIGIFVGCIGKSAQYPLHVWLPDAMEGPTPVSALIHAATMVAAGVYLVGRMFPLFTPEARLVIAYTGAITLFVAATIAIIMTDIKKVLAYSTVSQLGFMMLALGVGGWVAGLFHLLTHAFFKALLFLGSGSVIYGCHHEQEMTKMGGLFSKMKITGLTMLIGCLAIAGMPLFSGWYSKDAIIAHALGFVLVKPEHFLLLLLPLVTAAITTFYMFRMWFMTFAGTPRDAHVYEHAKESPWTMTVPLVVLAAFSMAVGWGWPIWDAEASQLGQHIHHGQHHAVYAEYGHLGMEHGDPFWENAGKTPESLPDTWAVRQKAHDSHIPALLLASASLVLGVLFAGLIYYYRVLDPAEAKEQFAGVYRFLSFKWYFDEFYSAAVVRPGLTVARWARAFDTYVIDGFINWIGWFAVRLSKWDGIFDNRVIDGLANVVGGTIFGIGTRLRGLQTGFLRSYVLFLVLAAIGIFAALSWFVAMATAG